MSTAGKFLHQTSCCFLVTSGKHAPLNPLRILAHIYPLYESGILLHFRYRQFDGTIAAPHAGNTVSNLRKEQSR